MRSAGEQEAGTMSGEERKTILIVDDDALVAMNARMALEGGGYGVVLARSGEEAVAAVEKIPGIDLILMDIKLGAGIDGTEAAEIILRGHDIPVVFFSSHSSPETVARTEKITSYGFVLKDSGDAVLLASIRMAFRLNETIRREREKEAQKEAAAQALRQSEEKYRDLVENSRDIIFTASTAGVFTFVSPAWTMLLGHPLSEVVGHSFQLFVHPDDAPRCESWLREIVTTGKPSGSYEYRVRHADGSWRWHRTNVNLLLDETGAVAGFTGSARDVTAQKQAEEALAHERFLLQVLMDNVPDYVYFKDRDSRFIRINKAHARLFGLSDPEQAAGKTDFEFFTEVHARQAFEDEQAIIRTGQPLSKEERETWADRPDSWVLTTKMPLRDEKGDLIGTFGISKDITARKQAEDESQQQLAEKEVLLREVHHRIRNNIASIGALLALHLNSVTHPEAVAALQDAIGRVDSMRLLYDKLMLGEGYKDVSVKDYVESLTDLVVALFPESAKVTVEKRIDDFHLDVKWLFPLGIIINELLTNKMKYAFTGRDAGLIMVSLARQDGRVTLVIEDDGLGPPEGFDAYEARGFGLTLVKMLSRQLKGSFSMEKRAGTRCTLEFPA